MTKFNTEKLEEIMDVYHWDDLSEETKLGTAYYIMFPETSGKIPHSKMYLSLLHSLGTDKENDWSDLAVRIAQSAVYLYPEDKYKEIETLGMWAHGMDHVVGGPNLQDPRLHRATEVIIDECVRRSVEIGHAGGYSLVCSVADYNYNCMLERGIEAGFAFTPPPSLQNPVYRELAQIRHDAVVKTAWSLPLGVIMIDHAKAPEQFFEAAKNRVSNRIEITNSRNLPLLDATLYDCAGTLRTHEGLNNALAAHYMTNIQFGQNVFIVTNGDPEEEKSTLTELGLTIKDEVRTKADFAGFHVQTLYDDNWQSHGLSVGSMKGPTQIIGFVSLEMQQAYAENLRLLEQKKNSNPGLQPL